MAPLPPGMLPLAKAIGFTAVALKLDPDKAFDLVLDALCDGAFYATAIFPSANGPPNSLTISPANWQMHKYNGAQLHYDFVEIVTVDLIGWLNLDQPQDAAIQEALANAVGLPFTDDRGLVRQCVRAVYEAAATQAVKPPNINELPEHVNRMLRFENLQAKHELIKEVGSEPDLAALRPKQGRKTTLKPLSDLLLRRLNSVG